MLLFLERWEITTEEAGELAWRMRIIDDELAKHDMEKQKEAEARLKNKGR